jgi:hypothetical protein
MKKYEFSDGKYVIYREVDGQLSALRHGVEWPGFEDLKHCKLIGCMLDQIDDLGEVLEDKCRLTRELDVALNGAGAAKQASLCDLVSQATSFANDSGPALGKRAAGSDVVILQINMPVTAEVSSQVAEWVSSMNEKVRGLGSNVQFVSVGYGVDVHIAKDNRNG